MTAPADRAAVLAHLRSLPRPLAVSHCLEAIVTVLSTPGQDYVLADALAVLDYFDPFAGAKVRGKLRHLTGSEPAAVRYWAEKHLGHAGIPDTGGAP